jgi:hypothetical protein
MGALLCALACAGCRQQMDNQPHHEPLEYSEFFPDGRSSRHPPAGTVAQGHLNNDEHLYQGLIDGKVAETFPFEVTREVLDRGQERFNIFCAPCHDVTGSGRGMIVQRGFPPPPTYHQPRLREAPPGHYFDVITNGFGAMYSHADRVPPHDRWAMIAYIRALQLARSATPGDVPQEHRAELE